MKRKGFTLIELLAVIIILGILMLIAIPSVTNYINNSRKETYVDTVKEFLKATSIKVNGGELEIYDTDTTYYIPVSAIDLENGEARSPYGKFDEAYAVVTYDGDNYNYYFVGRDESSMGIDVITKDDYITKESIKKVDDLDLTVGIRGKNKVVLFDDALNPGTPQNVGRSVSGNGIFCDVVEYDIVTYPEGKNKCTVEVGDLVTIGSEGFYVVKHIGDELVLLARYNLKVGYQYDNNRNVVHTYSSADEGYGIQSSDMIGFDYYGSRTSDGTLSFSGSEYWYNKIGTVYPGRACDNGIETDCAYVYDRNSNLYRYVESYRNYLSGLGVAIKDARLMSVEEAVELGCSTSVSNGSCVDSPAHAPSFVYSTSYWLGSFRGEGSGVWRVMTGGSFGRHYSYTTNFGVRPIIVY